MRRRYRAGLAAATVFSLVPWGAASASAHLGPRVSQRTAAGIITTIAGGVGGPGRATKIALSPCGAASARGQLYLAEDNGRVRGGAVPNGTFYGQAMAAGDIYTVAGGGAPKGLGDGGPATKARIREPQGVAVDRAGNLLITDARSRIRAVAVKDGRFYGQAMTANDIYTVVGSGNRGFSGDGGRATKAPINLPW